jgi:hypothetical protein
MVSDRYIKGVLPLYITKKKNKTKTKTKKNKKAKQQEGCPVLIT